MLMLLLFSYQLSLLLAMKRIQRHRFAAKRNATSDPHNFAYSDAADMGGIGK